MRSLGLCERTEKPCNHGMVAVSLVEPTLIQILSLLTQRVLNWVPQVVYLHSGCTVLCLLIGLLVKSWSYLVLWFCHKQTTL